MLIKEIPKSERPRERFLEVGRENLSNEELLSIIIKTGTHDKSVKDIALEVLSLTNNLDEFEYLSIEKLQQIKGIGLTKAIEIISSIEFGKRIILNNKIKQKIFKTPKEIYESMKYLFNNKYQEYFYCLYFNNKQELIERKLLFMGTVNKSIVHPREIFKEAYQTSATGIICMHNHPSGDVNPSKEDIILTNSLVEIGIINNIHVLDHIIVSNDSYYSFNENDKIGKI